MGHSYQHTARKLHSVLAKSAASSAARAGIYTLTQSSAPRGSGKAYLTRSPWAVASGLRVFVGRVVISFVRVAVNVLRFIALTNSSSAAD